MKKAFSLILCALFCLPGVLLCRAADDAQTGADGVLRFYRQSADVTSTQALIDGVWSDSAGRGSESLVLAAKQYQPGLDLSRYAANLKKYLAANTVESATSRELMALMLVLSGEPDPYITKTLNEAPGKLGVMSWVYALHLLNNGYTSTVTTLKAAREKLLSLRLSDGGWAVTGSVSDVDVTAMAVTSLAPAYHQDSAITAAIDGAIQLLSERQNADGTLSSYGVKNAESISQTIIALSALDIDAAQDSRFIQNGHTLFDALGSFRLADGSYCHELGGAANRIATAQAFSAFVAAYRRAHSLGSLYYIPPSQRPAVTQPTTAAPNGSSGADVKQTVKSAVISPGTESKTERKTERKTEPETKPATTALQPTNATTAAPSTEKAAPATAQATTQPSAQTGALSTQLPPTQPKRETTTAVSSAAALDESQSEPSTALSAEQSREETVESRPTEEPASSAEAEPTTTERPQAAKPKVKIKAVLFVVIWALAVGVCVVLFLLGRRNKSYYLAVLLAAVLLSAGLFATTIQRKEEFFSVPESVSSADAITASLSIRCDTIRQFAAENPAIPADGVILASSEITLAPDSTAYDQLLLAAKQNGFTFINKSAADNDYKDAYISTLAGLSEFDYGENSGWVFTVNGKMASVGCGAYRLKDGDRVEWHYTRNLGEDVTFSE